MVARLFAIELLPEPPDIVVTKRCTITHIKEIQC